MACTSTVIELKWGNSSQISHYGPDLKRMPPAYRRITFTGDDDVSIRGESGDSFQRITGKVVEVVLKENFKDFPEIPHVIVRKITARGEILTLYGRSLDDSFDYIHVKIEDKGIVMKVLKPK